MLCVNLCVCVCVCAPFSPLLPGVAVFCHWWSCASSLWACCWLPDCACERTGGESNDVSCLTVTVITVCHDGTPQTPEGRSQEALSAQRPCTLAAARWCARPGRSAQTDSSMLCHCHTGGRPAQASTSVRCQQTGPCGHARWERAAGKRRAHIGVDQATNNACETKVNKAHKLPKKNKSNVATGGRRAFRLATAPPSLRLAAPS